MAVVSSRGFNKTPPATSPASSSATPPASSPAQIAVTEARTKPSEGVECRCLMAGCELRAATAGKGPGTIIGYAAVFDKFSEDLGYFREKIQRGAFAGVLGQDVRALKNHDSNYLLGRSKNGTLRMVEDELGLRVEIDLPDTQVGRDAAVEVGQGYMDGMSFSFITDVDQWDYSGEVPIRTVIKVRDLYDVGPVAYPAYTDTSAAMRSLEKRGTDSQPAASPAAQHFDPLGLIRFRIQVEQASVLPAISE